MRESERDMGGVCVGECVRACVCVYGRVRVEEKRKILILILACMRVLACAHALCVVVDDRHCAGTCGTFSYM